MIPGYANITTYLIYLIHPIHPIHPGIYEEFQYPYLSYDGVNYACESEEVSVITSPKGLINGYVQLPENNYTALMSAIATVGPIAISVDASEWHSYESGVFSGCNQASPDIDHAVVLVGYGEDAELGKYWLVRNSWSPTFGEKGYIRVARQDSEEQVCVLYAYSHTLIHSYTHILKYSYTHTLLH